MVKNQYRAVARNLRISASKVRPVARVLTTLSYQRAVATLEAFPNKGAKMLLVLLQSAAANALHVNHSLSEEALYVKNVQVDQASTQKRIWCRGRGRADRQLMRYAHASIVLEEGGN